jgi:hypothetical protein
LLQPLFDVPYPLSDDPALRVYSIMHHLEGLIAEHGYFPLGYVRVAALHDQLKHDASIDPKDVTEWKVFLVLYKLLKEDRFRQSLDAVCGELARGAPTLIKAVAHIRDINEEVRESGAYDWTEREVPKSS